MEDKKFVLIAFDSTHYAITAEKVLNEKHMYIKLIPIYGEITAGCGLAAKIILDDKDTALALLNKKNVIYNGVYLIERHGFKKNITRIFYGDD